MAKEDFEQMPLENFNMRSIFSLFDSNLIVILGPVLEALTKAKPSENLTLTTSTVSIFANS